MNPRHGAPFRGIRHARRLRGHSVVHVVALTLVAVTTFGIGGLAAAYLRLSGNIETVDVEHLLGERPDRVEATPDPEDPNPGQPLNILLMGSDRRDGENAVIGGEVEGMRSDTTIVAHISADRSRVELVSIPRDSRVDIPSCNYNDGTTSRAQSGRFNAAFSIGAVHEDVGEAAACTLRTVESLTGLYIDEWAVVDFAGFQAMVNALDGVPMCIPQELYSEKAGLHLQPGPQTLNGQQALALARARTGLNLGYGSDLERLGRQHELLGAIVQQALSKNLLTDSPALLQFLDAATRSLTTSPDLGEVPALTGLAWSLRNIPSSNIVLMTIPNRTNPNDPNEVVWTEDAALVWSNMANDIPIVPPVTPPPTTDDPVAPADPSAPADPAVPPAPSVPSTPAPTPGVDPIRADDVATVCG